jgi:hypothetical protein
MSRMKDRQEAREEKTIARGQAHSENPNVDRQNRGRILRKRIKAIEKKQAAGMKLPVRVMKRLADYKAVIQSGTY